MSSTCNEVVFNVVFVPLTVKSPVIVKLPGIETVSLDALPSVVLPLTDKLPGIEIVVLVAVSYTHLTLPTTPYV